MVKVAHIQHLPGSRAPIAKKIGGRFSKTDGSRATLAQLHRQSVAPVLVGFYGHYKKFGNLKASRMAIFSRIGSGYVAIGVS